MARRNRYMYLFRICKKQKTCIKVRYERYIKLGDNCYRKEYARHTEMLKKGETLIVDKIEHRNGGVTRTENDEFFDFVIPTAEAY